MLFVVNLCKYATVDIVIGSRKEDILSPQVVFDDVWDTDCMDFAAIGVSEDHSYDVNHILPERIQIQRRRPGKCSMSIPDIPAGKQAIIQVPRPVQHNLKVNLWLTFKSKDHQSGVYEESRIEESVILAHPIYFWSCDAKDSEKRLIWKDNDRILVVGLSIVSSISDDSEFHWIVEWNHVRTSSTDSKEVKRCWNNFSWQLGSKLSLFAGVHLPCISFKEKNEWNGFAEFLLKIRHSVKDDLEVS